MIIKNKQILLMAVSAAFLFISCKKNNDDQIDSEQYYKAQLEKIIHLKEIPSSPGAKSTSGFKTYKEAYEAFSFVRTGAVFSVTTTVTPVKSSGTNQARIANNQTEYYRLSADLSDRINDVSAIQCRFNIDFKCQWEEGPGPDDWIPSVFIIQKTAPIYFYSGPGKMTSYGPYWSGLSFHGPVLGEITVTGATLSWHVNTEGGASIVAAPRPGETPFTSAYFRIVP